MPKTAQLPLFPANKTEAMVAPIVEPREPTRQSSLVACIVAFHDEMVRRGLSPNTIKAFELDLKLCASYLGADTKISNVTTRTLNNYLHWLKHERDVPCSPKSLERRLTSLKVFFEWLAAQSIVKADPAAPLVHERSVDPPQRILSEPQIEKFLNVARQHVGAEKPDARPYLLASLILHTGMKKGECAGILLEHLDWSDARAPTLWIRYGNARYARKERRLTLPKDFAETFAAYRTQYRPQAKLFECTPRHMEYILDEIAQEAGITEGVSFEGLRMTAAVRDYKAGLPPDTIRKKLGLSEITWNSETFPRIKKLAEPAL
jgi:integrase/recombinase XerD